MSLHQRLDKLRAGMAAQGFAAEVAGTPAADGARGADLPRGFFPALAAAFAALGLLMLPLFRYNITPDGTAYLMAAKKIAAGHFAESVSGHWSPLFSWLLVPLLKAGLPDILSIRLLNLLIGLGALAGTRRLARRFDLPPGLRAAVLAGWAAAVLSLALLRSTADILVLALLLPYFAEAFDLRFPAGRWTGARCGLIAGIAYLAKHYALPFFGLHYTVMCFLHDRRTGGVHRRKLLAHYLAGAAVSALVALPWIGVLSARYGKPTLCTSGAFCWSARSPALTAYPPLHHGFLPPPGPHGLSVWDDPSTIPETPWRAADSAANALHWARIIGRNVAKTIVVLETASVFALPAALAALLALLGARRRLVSAPRWYLPLLTAALYPVPYIPLFVDPRFLWPVYALLLLLGAQAIGRWNAGRGARTLLAGLFAASFAAAPVARIASNLRMNEGIRAMAETFAGGGAGGRLASHNEYRWSLYLAYFLGAQYYGVAPEGETDDARRAARLAELGVDYYAVWNGEPLPPYVDPATEVAPGTFADVRMFRLRPEPAAVSGEAFSGSPNGRVPRMKMPPGESGGSGGSP